MTQIMTPSIEEMVNTFLGRVTDAGEQLQRFSLDVEDKENQIKEALLRFCQVYSSFSIYTKDGQTLKENKSTRNKRKESLQVLLHQMIQEYQLQVEQWVMLIDQHLSGKEFINQFERSVLLTVFGNVNSGKSSLGNIIAGIPFESTNIPYSNEKPVFYVYDWSDGSRSSGAVPIEEQKFKENAKEETSTIQYFTLNKGLTWVDTPGIHSLNRENEDLAKKYVEFADLVLFIISSSSPGKADELNELAKLIRKRKPILVLITKSDETVRDIINGQIETVTRAKSEETRGKQENYLEESLQNMGLIELFQDRRFNSVSVKLAKKALEGQNAELFWDSNFPKFYEQISRVLSSQAIELKTERPRRAVNATLAELKEGFDSNQRVPGIIQMRESFEQLISKIEEQKKEVLLVKDKILKELQSNTIVPIEGIMMRYSMEFERGMTVSSDQAAKEISNVILDEFNRLLPIRIGNVLSDFEFKQKKSMDLKVDVDYRNKYDQIEFVDYQVIEKIRNPSGIIEHIQSFFGKEFYDFSVKESKGTKDIKVGTNSYEVLEKVISQTHQQLQMVVDQSVYDIIHSYFNRLEEVLKQITEQLNLLDNELQQLRYEER